MVKKSDKTDAIVASTGVDVAELAGYKSQAVELVEFLRHQPCKTADQETWFSEQLSNVRGLIKVLEDNRKSLTAPLNEAKRRVDALFKPATAPLEECESIIRGKLAAAAMGRMEAERAALQLAAEAATAGDTAKVMDSLAAVPDAVQTSGSSVSFVWEVASVVMDLLPREYMTVDHDKLKVVAKAAGGEEPKVPGVAWRRVAKVRAK